jgi:hypothetical protein
MGANVADAVKVTIALNQIVESASRQARDARFVGAPRTTMTLATAFAGATVVIH